MSKKIILAEFPHRDKSKAPKQFNDGLTTHERLKKIALKASGGKRCWWIYDFITRNPMQQIKKETWLN